MTSLTVDTIKKEVAITLPDQSEMSGHLFLSPYSELGVGPQTILEVLTGDKQFIPFKSGDGEYFFLNRQHIVQLSSPIEVTELPPPLTREKSSVTVQMRSGQLILGDLVMDSPEGRKRLSDGLNQARQFLILHIKDREVLINMNYVVLVS